MKKSLFVLCLLSLMSVFSYAQKVINEGKVVYKITYPEMELDNQTAAMLPSESVVFFKNTKSRTDVSMGMGMTTSTIIDSKTDSHIALFDMMGNKSAVITTPEEVQKHRDSQKNSKVIQTEEKKEIAGYDCKKIVLSNNDTTRMEMFYTDKINPKAKLMPEARNIEGFPLEYIMEQNGMKMKMTAMSVTEEKVSDDQFVIPPDYTVKTMEEMMKMFKSPSEK
jgi:hypothetical protein